MNISIKALFDSGDSLARELLAAHEYPWEVLDEISEYIMRVGRRLPADRYREVSKNVWIAKSASVSENAVILAPTIIDEECEVRQGAFIRGGAIIGRGCVIGNSTEIKNSVLLDGVQVPHYNYVGDSVLGRRAHLGAGAIISNLKSDKSEVTISIGTQKFHTGRRKLGAAVGDFAEIGCNSVLCPGAIVGRYATVYPLSRVRGCVAERCIMKGDGSVVEREERYDG